MTFSVKILGSNAAVPAYERNHTSQIVRLHGTHFMIDCGEGTQLQLNKYKVKHSKIDYVFISHLHGDHYLGLVGMLFTFHLFGRTKPLKIYGPKGLKEIILVQLKYSESELNYKVEFNEIVPEESTRIISEKRFEVYTIPLIHRIPCTGFLIKEKGLEPSIIKEKIPPTLSIEQIAGLKKGKTPMDDEGNVIIPLDEVTTPAPNPRSYAYCSDTLASETIVEYIKDASLLYHEATFLEELAQRAAMTFHSTAKEAAGIAKKANAGKLIIGHFSSRYSELDEFLSEAQSVFKDTELAIEGTSFEINFD